MPVRAVALFLTLLTGAAGLVYEVAWQKLLATLLGSHAEASAAVLGIFLAGLAVGYAGFGRLSRRAVEGAAARRHRPRLLALYGGVEIAIGVYAWVFPWLFAGAQRISLALPAADRPGALGLSSAFAADVALCALLIGPPAVLMGATVPVLTQALARDLEDATRLHARVYALNTAGAFVGALTAAFWLIPALGLVKVLWLVGSVNTAAGLGFLLLQRSATAPGPAPPAPTVQNGPSAAGSFAWAALLCGFASMALQTVTLRVGALAFGSSPFGFAIVVSVFVLCIALGSLGVSLLPRIRRTTLLVNQWALVALLCVLYHSLPHAPFWAHVLRSSFPSREELFLPYWLSTLGALVATIGAPLLLSGATLPLIFHHLRDRQGELGAAAGRLYGWNTVGSLLGAILGGYVLLQWLDLDGIYLLAVAAWVGAAVLLTLRVASARPAWALAAGGAVVVASVALFPAWDPALLSLGLFRERERTAQSWLGATNLGDLANRHGPVLFYDDDPVQSVAVREFDQGGQRVLAILNNGKSDGSTGLDLPTMSLAAALPALFADRTERAFVIGWGTGITAGRLASLPDMREVVVSEISPAVLEAAPLFDFITGDASSDPSIRAVRGDAYRTLSRDTTRYDIIVSEPTNPWVAGVEMLYSLEFLETARSRLAPGGVYVQWFHQYETSDRAIEIVLRTFARAFDEISVWYGAPTDLLILGFDAPAPAPEALLARARERRAEPAVARALEESGIDGLVPLLVRELVPLGVAGPALGEGPMQHLLHPILSTEAGRGFFLGHGALLPFTGWGEAGERGPERSLLRLHARASGGTLPEPERLDAIRAACTSRPELCPTLVSEWLADDPDSPLLQRLIAHHADPEHPLHELFEPGRLSRMAQLHRPAEGPPVEPVEALRALIDYRVHYLAAAPFEPDALRALWRRCPDCDGEAGIVDALLSGQAVRIRPAVADEPRDAEAPGP